MNENLILHINITFHIESHSAHMPKLAGRVLSVAIKNQTHHYRETIKYLLRAYSKFFDSSNTIIFFCYPYICPVEITYESESRSLQSTMYINVVMEHTKSCCFKLLKYCSNRFVNPWYIKFNHLIGANKGK